MGPVNKQDVQTMINLARSQIMDRMALKQDIQMLTDCVKNLLNVHQQNQQLLRQAEYQRLQLIRRMTAVETRMGFLEQQLRSSQGALTKVAQAQAQARPQQIVFTPASQNGTDYENQYAYRPSQG